MKAKLLCLVVLVLLTGCFLFGSPTATVKSFIAATQKGDIEGMTKLFSSKAIQKIGLDKLRENNQSFADTARKAAESSGSFQMENIQETSMPFDGKRVSFLYKSGKSGPGNDSLKLVFDLSKEGGVWKIDHIGGAEMEQGVVLATPTPANSPLMEEPPPPPPPSGAGSKTIAGGVLNGKATSLPKPPYPSVAKAVKASGTVVVQVTIDEEGNVVSAHAVSGHPLLQAVAVAAARSAKFSPTKLAGKPVRVSGVITYQFSPE